jgi:ubiquinone/menaquinone biosynthesis C-methylase UbiE
MPCLNGLNLVDICNLSRESRCRAARGNECEANLCEYRVNILEDTVKDDVSDIASYYDDSVEQEHTRLERHQLEYDLTWRYLTEYLPPAGTILEIGAATGRYTLPLCQRGYSVTAVDLSATLLQENQRRLAAVQLDKQARFVVADARDLSAVPDRDFDAVLLMGPLYHLILAEDRKQALRQAMGRLRNGGVLFSAFLSRLGVLGDLMKKMPEWIEQKKVVRSLLKDGRRPDDQPKGGFRGYFVRVSEIRPLHEELGIQTLALAGVEPAISADDESYNKLPQPQRDLWLDLLCEVSSDESTVGASRHLLYVGRKGDGAEASAHAG